MAWTKIIDETTKINGHALSSDVTISKGDVGLSNVENKSSATIRGEITTSNIPTLSQSKISGLTTDLAAKALKTTQINGHALSSNVTVSKGDVGLSNVENKSSATIRSEITKANITNTGLKTSDIIASETTLPTSGTEGEIIKFNSSLYVWKTS